MRRRLKFTTKLSLMNDINKDIIRYWSYKLVIGFSLWKLFKNEFIEEKVIDFLDITCLYKNEELNVSKKVFYNEIKKRFNDIHQDNNTIDPTLLKNVKRISRIINLNSDEEIILLFIIITKNSPEFIELIDSLGELNILDVYEIISCLLDIPLNRLKKVFNHNSALLQSGLVRIDKTGVHFFQFRFNLMDGFEEELFLTETRLESLFCRYFLSPEKSLLKLKDFDYLSNQIQLVLNLLKACKKDPIKGINILLYGPPGTGKTELSRIFGQEVQFKLHEVAMKNIEGEAIEGDDRFSAYCLAQYILKNNPNNLIVFDEIEDVFPDPFFSLFTDLKQSTAKKAWINRLLETNNVPTIWISNDVQQIDDAFKRRFKLILKVDIPPQKTRLKIIKQNMSDLQVSYKWLKQLSQHGDISPALISQTAEIISHINSQEKSANQVSNQEAIENKMTQILNNSLECMGKPKISHSKSETLIDYNPEVLNADTDISELIKGLQNHKQGRLCLYGPPGTGKTAFGHHIASKLNRSLLTKRASDILPPYVGEAEMNIAKMFEQARCNDSVLLLDEADSFLMNRKSANYNWEITQVNELLTQMEAFKGIFICSTNLMDNLDNASIRRFDLKIKFDYLKDKQVWLLFKQILSDRNKKNKPDKKWKQQLSNLNNLTPGDFAIVVRQNNLSSDTLDAYKLYEGLKSESLFKNKNKRSIGFMTSI